MAHAHTCYPERDPFFYSWCLVQGTNFWKNSRTDALIRGKKVDVSSLVSRELWLSWPSGLELQQAT
jgi:hypothetical protein